MGFAHRICLLICFQVPTILDLKKTIPAHCFRPTLSLSMYYVVKDYVLVAALYASMVAMEQLPESLR